MPGNEQDNDQWGSELIVCKGGLDLAGDALTQGLQDTGKANALQNYEPSEAGGYARILGYNKYDTNTVPGQGAILGVKVGGVISGVFAARLNAGGTSYDIYSSGGVGWTKINTATRFAGTVLKTRFISYSITAPALIGVDGVNPAFKWDGSTYTTINGTGAPTAPKCAAMFLASLWLGQGSILYGSAPNADTDFAAGDGALAINVGDTIMGLKSFRGTLYIFCRNSIYELDGTSVANFIVTPVTLNIGCVSADTIVEVGGDLTYLSGEGFRSLSGTMRIGDVDLSLMSRPITPALTNNGAIGLGENAYSACAVRAKSQYRCFFNQSLSTNAAAFGVLGKYVPNTQTPYLVNSAYEWATIQGINAYCADSAETTSLAELVVFGHPSDGFVYQLESGNAFGTDNIISIYQTPYLFCKDPTLRKVLQRLTLLVQLSGNLSVNLTPLLDFLDMNVMQPQVVPISVATSLSLYGSAVYGTGVYSIPTVVRVIQTLQGSAKAISFQFICSSNSLPSHRIDSMVLEFGLKGRR